MARSSQQAAGPRSIALVGPYGSGKSTLFEALMGAAGAAVKHQGNGRTHMMSTEIRLGHCSFLGDPWSVLDCPGSVEFSYDTELALRSVDLAVIVCDSNPDHLLSLPLMMQKLEDLGLPHFIFVNKIDVLSGSVEAILATLQAQSKYPLLSRELPIREGEAITGYIDVVSGKAYHYQAQEGAEPIELPHHMRQQEQQALAGLTEVLADRDDALLEKILEDIPPTTDEIYQHLRKDQAEGAIVEVFFGAAARDYGIARLWKALRHDVPAASVTAARKGIVANDQPLLQIFKTIQAGKLALGRIWRGTLRDGAQFEGLRVSGLFHYSGGESIRLAQADAGDLVGLGRLEEAKTGMVLGAFEPLEALRFPAPPAPVHSIAIEAKDRKDDVKLSGALHKLIEEDPALSLVRDLETGETILHGQGEIHLNVALERLASIYNLQINAHSPKIAYKETIAQPISQHSRLKRQTGGHGQFADVKLEIEPRERGAGFSFTEKIVGGSVPKNYIPAIREAAEEALVKGPLGFHVVDIAVTLVDGTFHAVDSSDMAFKTATRMAITEGLAKARPILLEPIDHVKASVPNIYTAITQRLLTGRRGQILGYHENPDQPGWDEVEALVPEAELHDFIIELRSDTMGLGSYVHHFDHLAETRG